jgi:uncharacterized membrane protein YeaQ/YmgE (transglycosylase-associated protein family)
MTVLDLIGWLIIGAIAGWLASMVMGRGGYGLVGDIVVGIIGAFIGGFVARLLNVAGPAAADPFSWVSLIFAIVGAIILIAVVRALTGGRTRL